MPHKPKTPFERELHHLIYKHLGKPKQMDDYDPIWTALEQAVQPARHGSG